MYCLAITSQLQRYTYTVFIFILCLKKVSHLMFVNNVDKCGPIFKILFTNWFVRKFSMYTLHRFPPHLQYVATLPNPKSYWFWQHLQQTVDTESWGHFEHLIYHLTVVRQTASRLLTLTDWLTFWSLSDDVSNQQLNVVQLNIVTSWGAFCQITLTSCFRCMSCCWWC